MYIIHIEIKSIYSLYVCLCACMYAGMYESVYIYIYMYNLCIYRTYIYIIHVMRSRSIDMGLPTVAPTETGKEDITQWPA